MSAKKKSKKKNNSKKNTSVNKPAAKAPAKANNQPAKSQKPAEKPVAKAAKQAEKPIVKAQVPAEKPVVKTPAPAEKPAVKAPVPAEKPVAAASAKQKIKPGILCVIIIAVLAVIAALYLFLSHTVVWLGKELRKSSAESISAVIEAKEVPKLDYFTKLKEADLSGSECYREIYAWGEAHPDVKLIYDVQLPEGTSYDAESGTADLGSLGKDAAIEAVEEHALFIQGIKEAKIDLSGWTIDDLDAFQTAHPELNIKGTLSTGTISIEELKRLTGRYKDVTLLGSADIAGQAVPFDAESVSFAEPSQEAFVKLADALDYLPSLKTADFGTDEEGHSRLKEVYDFQQAHPEITVDYHFTVFGKKAGLHDEKLDLNHRKMSDRGAEVRSVIAYMPDLTFLDMDSCGVGDEDMASIRDDFPNIKVVWRIWFGGCYSVRTNVERILASAPETAGSLTPYNSRALKYCTDIKYLDVGHNEDLRTIDFVRYMPNLEVFICMWCDIHDISALRNCPHLEFLEVFTDWITDLSPLSEMHELKHLNICHNPYLKDLSPIYGLTQLERLWIGNHTGIPKSQIEHFRELAPDCRVNDTVGDAHDGWRGDEPRYQLLRKQMGYHYPEGPAEYAYYWNDPLYYPHDDE